MVSTVERVPAGIRLIDQRRLPRETVFVTCTTAAETAEAIRTMVVRGAPPSEARLAKGGESRNSNKSGRG
jgi:methylthioribose-1-phosphate isomerase